MGKYINPFTDVGFKRIFGQEISKDILISFLNALLENEKKIKDITFLDKEQLPYNILDHRGVIYDIFCTTENGEHFIVEMQNKEQLRFKERALYYLSRAISRQGESGEKWMFDLKAVYGVFFMNFKFKKENGKLRTDVILADRDTHEPFSDKLRMIFLELPYFDKEENECENDFERWMYVLKNMPTLERLPFKARISVIERLEKIVELASMTRQERFTYDRSVDAYRDLMSVMLFSQQEGLEEGFTEGHEKGFIKGREEGMAQGRAEGREEGKMIGLEMAARQMKVAGVGIEMISQCTGLPLEFIEKL